MSAVADRIGQPVDLLLSRLDGVRHEGKGWRALCPACGGKSRKLAITEGDDGRVLLHCFAGCEALDVVQGVGLSVSDLFPERIRPETPEERRVYRRKMREVGWLAALDALDIEATVVLLASRQLAAGQALSAADGARLSLAVKRVSDARAVLRGR